MSRERMSRPSSSDPQICSAEGGANRVERSMCAGSAGAIQGAKIAQITKNVTNTAPMAASGLRRASRGSDMAVVVKQLDYIPKACHSVLSRETCFPRLAHWPDLKGTAFSRAASRAYSSYGAAGSRTPSKQTHVFSNLLAPTEQVPRVRAIIRKWMIQLRWE